MLGTVLDNFDNLQPKRLFRDIPSIFRGPVSIHYESTGFWEDLPCTDTRVILCQREQDSYITRVVEADFKDLHAVGVPCVDDSECKDFIWK